LRAKIQAKSSSSATAASASSLSDTPNTNNTIAEDPLAFLHGHKQTKRDKLLSKRDNFLTKIQTSNTSNVSKSTLRRIKRKAKEQLKPKMEDLLTALDEAVEQTEGNTEISTKKSNINIVPTQKFISKNPKNLPNAKNKSGVKCIEKQERERFGSVLKDSKFKQSPFAALRENISQRLQSL
jgi:ribosome biogenesis protein SLX9